MNNEPIIIFKGGYEPPIIDMFKQDGVPLRIEYAVSTVTTSLNMIQEGLGLAILAELSLSNLPPNVRTRELEPHVWREIGLAVPSLKESWHFPMEREHPGGELSISQHNFLCTLI
ncbi:hypothetical protein bpmyx0001_16530 [Bacillus pseudomycoides DSM 12442]|nr:hypothetical protein bpmyx0001_16530 [Bacillus pseudomycoides DSM 12442]